MLPIPGRALWTRWRGLLSPLSTTPCGQAITRLPSAPTSASTPPQSRALAQQNAPPSRHRIMLWVNPSPSCSSPCPAGPKLGPPAPEVARAAWGEPREVTGPAAENTSHPGRVTSGDVQDRRIPGHNACLPNPSLHPTFPKPTLWLCIWVPPVSDPSLVWALCPAAFIPTCALPCPVTQFASKSNYASCSGPRYLSRS